MNLFKGKVVLITGHTGFKGSWLSIWLTHLGAKVFGISDGTGSNPSNFSVSEISNAIVDNRLDVRDANAIKKIIENIQPDFVFHLAAQALVRTSYETPLDTITINAIGSANVSNGVS
jgi:CDP-glucose 4,6-dehydratase